MKRKKAHNTFQTLILAATMVFSYSNIKAGEPGKMDVKYSQAMERNYEVNFNSIVSMHRNMQINAAATGNLQKRKKSGFEKALHFDPRIKFVLGKNMYLQLSYN